MIALPHFPFVVIDMNTCRKPEEMGPLLAAHVRDGLTIVLPMVANWELTKGSVGTLPAALRSIAGTPGAVSIARHSRVLKHRELETRRPLRMRDLVSHAHTRNLRDVMRGLHADTHDIDPRTLANVRTHWRVLLDAENEPKILRALVAIHKTLVPQKKANELRHALLQEPPDRGLVQAYLRDAIGNRTALEKFIRGVGYGSSRGKHLVRFASLSILHMIALHSLALHWRVFGGIESTPDHKLENDAIDVEYALLASYGRDFVTADLRARGIYEDIVAVAALTWT